MGMHGPGKGGKGGKAGGKSDKVEKANIVDSGRVHKIGIALSKLKVSSSFASLFSETVLFLFISGTWHAGTAQLT